MKLWLVEQACDVLDSARWRRTHGACSSLPSDTRVESALLPRPPTCNVVCDGAAAMMMLRLVEQQACDALDGAEAAIGWSLLAAATTHLQCGLQRSCHDEAPVGE